MSSERYLRQGIIPSIGARGQANLSAASVFVVGCGGLGSALLYDLACMGIGRIGFTDGDTVSESDLNRQFLHTTSDIGRRKADSALEKLAALNPEIVFAPHSERLNAANAATLLSGYDVVALAVDTIESRLCANAYCMGAGIPLVDGGIDGFSGRMTVAFPGKPPCLKCLYGEAQTPPHTVGSFAPVVTMVSALEAQAVALLLLGQGDELRGTLFFFDGASLALTSVSLSPSPACPVCATNDKKESQYE